jgi:hypothetical protein
MHVWFSATLSLSTRKYNKSAAEPVVVFVFVTSWIDP